MKFINIRTHVPYIPALFKHSIRFVNNILLLDLSKQSSWTMNENCRLTTISEWVWTLIDFVRSNFSLENERVSSNNKPAHDFMSHAFVAVIINTYRSKRLVLFTCSLFGYRVSRRRVFMHNANAKSMQCYVCVSVCEATKTVQNWYYLLM